MQNKKFSPELVEKMFCYYVDFSVTPHTSFFTFLCWKLFVVSDAVGFVDFQQAGEEAKRWHLFIEVQLMQVVAKIPLLPDRLPSTTVR